MNPVNPGSGLALRHPGVAPIAQPRRVPTIRSRLALLAVASVLPAALMVALLIAENYRQSRIQMVRDATAAARALVSALDRELAGVQAALSVLATSPHLTANDMRAFDQQAREVLPNLIANNIVLVDPTGQQRVNTIRPFGDPLPADGKHQLQRIIETGRPMITDLFYGPISRKPALAVGVPVRRGGAVLYSLNTGIVPERLSGLLSQQHLPAEWIAAIFDSTGTTVARTHEMGRFLGKKGTPVLVRRMGEVIEDSMETTTLEGIPVLTVFSRSAISNWTVAIGIPTRELAAELRESLWMLLGATAALLLGSFALAWRIGGQIAASVHALTEPALALALGKAVSPPELGLKETDEVAGALARASLLMRDSQHRANHDALTGLAHRALLKEILDHQLAVCARTGGSLTVLYIDLDGFKAVNDTHGHAVGDELLRAVAARIKHAVRPTDIAARLGGDEFAIVLVNTGMKAAAAVVRKLADGIAMPYPIGELTITISASIGSAAFPDAGDSSEALLHCADEGMYTAKSGRKAGSGLALT